MARKKEITARARTGGGKRRLIITGLILLVLYIGAQGISRTDGVRNAVADKISNGTRLPVTLESCGATPLLGLKLKGLMIPGVEVPEVELSFNWFSFLSKDSPFVKQLELRNAKVRFKRIPESGNWQPLVLNGVARRLGAVVGLNPTEEQKDDNLPVFPPYAINAKTQLRVHGAKVSWLDEKGLELAYLLDGDLKETTGRFTKRKAVQTLVKCGQIRLASGRILDDFKLEAFRVEGSDWVTVLQMSDREGQYDEFASRSLWQDLSLYLNQLSAVK